MLKSIIKIIIQIILVLIVPILTSIIGSSLFEYYKNAVSNFNTGLITSAFFSANFYYLLAITLPITFIVTAIVLLNKYLNRIGTGKNGIKLKFFVRKFYNINKIIILIHKFQHQLQEAKFNALKTACTHEDYQNSCKYALKELLTIISDLLYVATGSHFSMNIKYFVHGNNDHGNKFKNTFAITTVRVRSKIEEKAVEIYVLE